MRVLALVPMVEIRAIKLCEVLTDGGARVTLALEKHSLDVWDSRLERMRGLRVERVSLPRLPTQLLWNPVRIRALARLLRDDYDLLYARDIFMGQVVLAAAARLAAAGRPRPQVVVDVADDFVAVLRDAASPLRRLYGRLARVRAIEERVMRGADRLLFVVPEAVDHYQRRHGVDLSARARVVRNVPNGPLGAGPPPPPAERAGEALYVGTLDRGIRDFEAVLAADAFLTRPVCLDCYVFGAGRDAYARELAARAAGSRMLRLRFHEAVPTGGYADLLDRYRVGVIPHRRNEICDATVPNKLYDYLDRGLQVVASDNPAMVSELDGEPRGWVYRGEDARSLAQALEGALERSAADARPPRWPREGGAYFPAQLAAALAPDPAPEVARAAAAARLISPQA